MFNIKNITRHRDHNGWRLYIQVSSAKKFREIIEPFMLKEMMYKIKSPVETTRKLLTFAVRMKI